MISVHKAQELLDRASEQLLDAIAMLRYLAREGQSTLGDVSNQLERFTIPRLEFWLTSPDQLGSILNLRALIEVNYQAVPKELSIRAKK